VVRNAFQLLSFPDITFEIIAKIWPEEISQIDEKTKNQISINALYSSYLKRQEQDLAIFRQDENLKIPLDLDYAKIQSLSLETREKLSKFRPATIRSALRIQGITPASIMAVMVYIKNLVSPIMPWLCTCPVTLKPANWWPWKVHLIQVSTVLIL
jgi:tRNA uridine 5-carboxymethylaminomethyl modification enzyme